MYSSTRLVHEPTRYTFSTSITLILNEILFLLFFQSFSFFWSSSLVARAHTINCGEVGRPGFEPQPLHKLFNVPTEAHGDFQNFLLYHFITNQ